MRATSCLLALLALQLVGPRAASAQSIPMPTTCTIVCTDGPHQGSNVCPHDCNDNGAELQQCVECSCYDRCGGESSSGGGAEAAGASDSNQKSDPIGALANLVMLVIMPGVLSDSKRDPATVSAEVARAEADWGNFRGRIEELEQAGRDWSRNQREQRKRAAQLDRDLREAAASKGKPAVPQDYQKIPAAPDKKQQDAKRWAPHGYCSNVLDAQDKLLRNAKKEADKAAREQGAPILPTPEAALDDAKEAAGQAGRAMLATRNKELGQLLQKADEFAALMKALLSCTTPGKDLTAANNCLNAVLVATKSGPVKAVLQKVLGKRTAAAVIRVRDFAQFYVSYVNKLRIQAEELALAATRCL